MQIHFFEMVLRTTGAFFAMLFLARIIGKKQLSQLTFFHYVTGITFGSIAAEISSQIETPFWDGFIALVWWTVLTILVSYLSFKSKTLRVVFDDKPTIIIQNGRILPQALSKTRLNLDELVMLLREQNIFSVAEVDYAIFETNGKMSIMKKTALQAASKQDVKVTCHPVTYLPTEVISNGKIIHTNLTELQLTEDWLIKKLKKKNIHEIKHVFYAQVLENGSLFVSLKQTQRIP